MRRESASARAVRLINNLTHTGDFAGQPFTLRPWQARVIRELFKTNTDGLRQYRTMLLMLPRKNGKTELAAAIAIYGLLFDGVTGGEIYLAAADRDQAAKVYQAIVAMLQADDELAAAVEIVESQKRIVHRRSGSFCKAISAEAYSKHGFNASMVIYDELHCAPNRDLWDVLATSQGARRQPLLIAISTAGYDRHSILWELYAHAKKVQDTPSLDPTFLPVIYEAPIEADWLDETVWKQANPALGDFRSLEDMRILAARAREIPAQENSFRRLYLNQWTEQAARWITLAAWDACHAAIEPSALIGRRCYVGMDLSSTQDLTAIAAVFPDDAGDGYAVQARCFCPAENIRERARRDRVPYDEWARRGQLEATPGNRVDYAAVRRVLLEWKARYQVCAIAFDPWNASELTARLLAEDRLPVQELRQGFASMSGPTKSLERGILAGHLRHDGDPVLRWCVSNVAIEQDPAGNVKLSKKASSEKIDGVVALAMAVGRLDAEAAARAPAYQILVFGGGR